MEINRNYYYLPVLHYHSCIPIIKLPDYLDNYLEIWGKYLIYTKHT